MGGRSRGGGGGGGGLGVGGADEERKSLVGK